MYKKKVMFNIIHSFKSGIISYSVCALHYIFFRKIYINSIRVLRQVYDHNIIPVEGYKRVWHNIIIINKSYLYNIII